MLYFIHCLFLLQIEQNKQQTALDRTFPGLKYCDKNHKAQQFTLSSSTKPDRYSHNNLTQ